jgi:hypothetical protein
MLVGLAVLRVLAEHDHVVKLRLVLPLVVFLDAAVGGDGKGGELEAGGKDFLFRVAGQVAEQNDFVHSVVRLIVGE